MQNFFKQLDPPDYLFILGAGMLYAGLVMLFGHAVALAGVGAVFIMVAVFVAVKGGK